MSIDPNWIRGRKGRSTYPENNESRVNDTANESYPHNPIPNGDS